MEKPEQDEIDLSYVFHVLLNKIWIILIVTVVSAIVGALGSFVVSKVSVKYGATVKYDLDIYAYRDSDPDKTEKKENLSFEARNLAEIVDELSSGAFNVSLMAQLKDPVVTDPESPDFNAKAFEEAFRQFNEYVTYSYNATKNVNAVIVNVSVPKEALAKEILALVKKDVPSYIAKNITVPLYNEKITEVVDGNVVTVDWIRYATDCEEISHSYCHELDTHKTASKALQWGAIVGIVGFIVVCFVVLLTHKSKTQATEDAAEQNTNE